MPAVPRARGTARRRRLCQRAGCANHARGNDYGAPARFCRRHGGGPKCTRPGCRTSAEGNGLGGKPLFCKVHGGGPRCQRPGCTFSAERDGTKTFPRFCQRHGGGYRCQHPDHVWPGSGVPPSASFAHGGARLCHQHYYNSVNGTCRAIRREIVVLGEIMTQLPPLLGISHEDFQEYFVNHDSNIRSCKLLRRPDMLFCFPRFAILLEIDEHQHRTRTELSELEHLDVIRQYVQHQRGQRHLYVLRINPDGLKPMFRKRKRSNGEMVWEPSEYFIPKFGVIVRHLAPWVRCATAPTHRLRKYFDAAPQGCVVHKLYFEPGRSACTLPPLPPKKQEILTRYFARLPRAGRA